MTDEQVRTLVIVIGAILFAIVAFVFWRTQKAGKKNRDLNEHKQLQQEQQKALQDYEQSIRSLLKEIEKESCDTETALAISEQCRQYIGGNLTGQSIVDALLAYKRKECDDRGIQLEMETTAFPSEGFSGEEYVGILGNLLDNAMVSPCLKVGTTMPPVEPGIRCILRRTNGAAMLSVLPVRRPATITVVFAPMSCVRRWGLLK